MFAPETKDSFLGTIQEFSLNSAKFNEKSQTKNRMHDFKDFIKMG